MKNPRSIVTSSFGGLIIVCALIQFIYYLFDGDPNTNPDMRLILEVIAGTAFLFTKDWNSTHVTEQEEKDK